MISSPRCYIFHEGKIRAALIAPIEILFFSPSHARQFGQVHRENGRTSADSAEDTDNDSQLVETVNLEVRQYAESMGVGSANFVSEF